MKTALLLIDIQNDYFPGGRMEVHGSTAAALAAKRVLNHFREKKLPVIHIQHISARPGARFFLPDTEGVNIHGSVTPLPSEPIFRKNYPSAFRDTPLLDHLKTLGLDELVICGMMTHMCVDSTVRAAFDHGFRSVVLSDACATIDLRYGDVTVPAEHVHAAFIAALGAVFARVTTVEDFLSNPV
jgi:nicotinamidase-related amidase